MSADLCLRCASLEDGDLLLQWRNDPLTRAASHATAEIPRETHLKWLAATLSNSNRQLYIVEEGGTPVGTVRADFDPTDNSYRLSWTVAPRARGRGIGKQMVALLAGRLRGSLRAEMKVGNIASARVAEGAGLRFQYAKEGIMYFRRPPLENSSSGNDDTSPDQFRDGPLDVAG